MERNFGQCEKILEGISVQCLDVIGLLVNQGFSFPFVYPLMSR